MTVCYPDTTNWGTYVRAVLPDNPTEEQTAAYELAHANEELAASFAWTTLQTLTAFQVGLCPVHVRPCRKRCREGSFYTAPVGGSAPFRPAVVDGQWINLWCGHREECSCTEVREVVLPGPVGQVTLVKVDGEVIPNTSYRIDEGNRLVRTDGEGWPLCQDMNLNDGEGTFIVEYVIGAHDSQTDFIAGVLAREWLLAITGAKGCKLSSKVTAVTRQGVNYEMEAGVFENGLTGIDMVDMYTARWNPYRLKTRPRVMSPDTLRNPRRVTIGPGH